MQKVKSIFSFFIISVMCVVLTSCKCDHDFSSKGTITKEPTCTSEGMLTYTCSRCGFTKNESIPVSDHSFDSGTVEKEPTCTSEGVLTYTCLVCGTTKNEPIQIKEHIYNEGKVITEPTCNAEGVLGYTCLACGNVKTEPIPKTEHSYESKVTKEATFSEAGKKTYTCTVCGNSYTETIPKRDDEVVVTVTGKKNLAEDWDANRYSPRVEFAFNIKSNSSKSIKGVQGILHIKDIFGVEIITSTCDFTGQTIPANGAIDVSGIGMDINEFMDDHVKLYTTDFSDLNFAYDVTEIVYGDDAGTSKNVTSGSNKVSVKVTDKKNLSENWNAGRYSARVEFEFYVTNNTSKDIKGIQGVLKIKDLFGKEIISFGCDFTGQKITANKSVTFDNLGIDINEFMDDHVKLYNEDFSDLKFEYSVTSIVYSDGTAE